MPSFFISIALLMFLLVGGCSYSDDHTLLQRLNARLPQYDSNYQTKKPIPRYESPVNNNIYNGQLYPTYEAEADNPSYQVEADVSNQYSYPVYDAEADNPYYGDDANNSFSDRVYPEVYPTYEQDADNPYYPQAYYSDSPQPQQQYQYQYYSPEADNPILPSSPSNGLFDSPSFDAPLFAD